MSTDNNASKRQKEQENALVVLAEDMRGKPDGYTPPKKCPKCKMPAQDDAFTKIAKELTSLVMKTPGQLVEILRACMAKGHFSQVCLFIVYSGKLLTGV